jgi:Bladder cancer-related protein BC10
MMYCLRTYIPLLLLPLPLSLSPIHLTTLLILTYILNRPCIYCSFLLIVLFGSSCAWQSRCLWSAGSGYTYTAGTANTGNSGNGTVSSITDDGLGGFGWAAYFFPRIYTTPLYTHTHTYSSYAYSPTNETTISAFLAEITSHTLTGLAAAAKETGVSVLSDIKRKVVDSTAEAASYVSVSGGPLSSFGSGIGTQWVKNLLGRSEWTLPCVGVKVVI